MQADGQAPDSWQRSGRGPERTATARDRRRSVATPAPDGGRRCSQLRGADCPGRLCARVAERHGSAGLGPNSRYHRMADEGQLLGRPGGAGEHGAGGGCRPSTCTAAAPARRSDRSGRRLARFRGVAEGPRPGFRRPARRERTGRAAGHPFCRQPARGRGHCTVDERLVRVRRSRVEHHLPAGRIATSALRCSGAFQRETGFGPATRPGRRGRSAECQRVLRPLRRRRRPVEPDHCGPGPKRKPGRRDGAMAGLDGRPTRNGRHRSRHGAVVLLADRPTAGQNV